METKKSCYDRTGTWRGIAMCAGTRIALHFGEQNFEGDGKWSKTSIKAAAPLGDSPCRVLRSQNINLQTLKIRPQAFFLSGRFAYRPKRATSQKSFRFNCAIAHSLNKKSKMNMQDNTHSNEMHRPSTGSIVNRKGGRPRKKRSEKKCVTYSAHATAVDALMIEAKRRQSGLCKSEFTLASLLSVKVIARLPMQVMDWLRDIAGMANNINQLAKEAHTRGYASVHHRLTALAENIENLINQIYNYKEGK